MDKGNGHGQAKHCGNSIQGAHNRQLIQRAGAQSRTADSTADATPVANPIVAAGRR